MPNTKGKFNRVIAAILAANDQVEDASARERIRQVVLSEVNDLRRWTEEVLDEVYGKPVDQSTHIPG